MFQVTVRGIDLRGIANTLNVSENALDECLKDNRLEGGRYLPRSYKTFKPLERIATTSSFRFAIDAFDQTQFPIVSFSFFFTLLSNETDVVDARID